MMKYGLIPVWAFVALLIWSSCVRPDNPIAMGPLMFSTDTVKFDSIFVNFRTPSERLLVYNPGSQAVEVAQVWLDEGEDSEFSLIVDGVKADTVQDLVIAAQDSMLVIVNLESELRDDFAEEFLNVQIGDERYQVLLRARVIDAYYFRARLTQEGGGFVSLSEDSYFFGRSGVLDTTLTPDKPIIFDGPIFIPEGVTVRVLPGTKVFFTPYKFGVADSSEQNFNFGFFSWLLVDGTLRAEGTPEAPVVFRGTRFDSAYQENPAQWRGLSFRQNSRDNLLKHAEVKNGMIGVQVDSASVNQNPKLTMQHTAIRNMGAFGVVGVGAAPGQTDFGPPSILMENSYVSTCQQRTFIMWYGGKYEFYNCTFANYNVANFSRREPQVYLNNWLTPDGQNALVYPTYLDMKNCIIYGSEDNEVVLDTLAGQPFERVRLDHCLIRVDEEEGLPPLRGHLADALLNQDPRFDSIGARDYRLRAGSPAIDAGLDLSDRYLLDFRGVMDSSRSLPFDLGAYEYIPE